MFTGKLKEEMQQFKEDMSRQMASLSSSFSQRLQDQDSSLEDIKKILSEINRNNCESAEKLKDELNDISKIKNDFETALNKINSIGRSIEITASNSVKEVADKELEMIRMRSKQFREVEDSLNETLENLSEINLEISKFIDISNQIKLVDFSLSKHKDDLRDHERERSRLIDQNERLKSILAKMKRNR